VVRFERERVVKPFHALVQDGFNGRDIHPPLAWWCLGVDSGDFNVVQHQVCVEDP